MNLKNIIVILLFLFCILGLIFGIYYNETTNPTIKNIDGKKAVHEHSKEKIITEHYQKDNNAILDNLFTKLNQIPNNFGK